MSTSPTMDPIFGLPCTADSRAMELARSRNHIANKNLAQKFEALDLAQRTRSGKNLSRWKDLHGFLTSIEHNQSNGLSLDRGVTKKSASSMSLEELDRRLHAVKGLKMATDAAARSRFPHADEPKLKATSLYKDGTCVSLVGAFDENGHHIVDLERHDKYLSISRKKHAMREAWDRATSVDMQYKRMGRRHSSQDLATSCSVKTRSQDRHDFEKTSPKIVIHKTRHNETIGKH